MCLTTKKQNQTFVTHALKEVLETVANIPESCIIESDNCSTKYKSLQHFDNIRNICTKIGVPVILLFSVTWHGKGEVDHVGGLAKYSARRYVGIGGKVLNVTDCKDFLETKFAEKPNPKFFLKLIDGDDLADSRAEARLKKYLTIEGSDSFQVMVFQPNFTIFKAAFHLCICGHWLIDYGSCSPFCSHELWTQILKKIFLRSEMEINGQISGDQTENVSDEFILADTYCAVVPNESSPESVWFIKVKDSFEQLLRDRWLRKFNCPWSPLYWGRFMEKVDVLAKWFMYKLFKKKTFF